MTRSWPGRPAWQEDPGELPRAGGPKHPPERRLERLQTFWERITARKVWHYTPDGDVYRKADQLGDEALKRRVGEAYVAFMTTVLDHFEPYSAEYVRLRNHMEPLIEIMQIKGNSEVQRKFWAADEFAGFENADSMAKYSGRTALKQNYVRWGVIKGLDYDSKLGANPFQYGFIGDGWDVGARMVLSFNTKNKDTNYKSGTMFNVDFAAMKFVTEDLRLGVQGYVVNQLTKDSSDDANVQAAIDAADGAKMRAYAAGPALGWIVNGGEMVVEGKLLKEFGARNRSEGTTYMLMLSKPFGL